MDRWRGEAREQATLPGMGETERGAEGEMGTRGEAGKEAASPEMGEMERAWRLCLCFLFLGGVPGESGCGGGAE